MCTASWLRRADGYDLLFNRDELKSRGVALPPRVFATGNVRWVAPVDPDSGGTWIASSERGVTLAILNGPRLEQEERAWKSRGLLPPALAARSSAAEVEAGLAGMDLGLFRAFRLLAIFPQPPVLLAEWNGRELRVDRDREDATPLVSSAFEESAVGAARRAEFARLLRGEPPTLQRLLSFHRSTHGGPNAYTVAMERAEAATQSLTHVSVTAAEVVQDYFAGRPDRAAPPVQVRLERSREASSAARSR